MSPRVVSIKSNDNGVCRYGDCQHDIEDGITIQLCRKHLRTAYAAFLITNPEMVAHQRH